jgi:hypothetical protein
LRWPHFATIKLGSITVSVWAYNVHLQVIDLRRCAQLERLPCGMGGNFHTHFGTGFEFHTSLVKTI